MPFTPGIDVSHWQAMIDWKAVAATGVKFAILKATDGTGFVDDTYARNWKGTRDNGLIRGAYHFFRPLMDARKQAELFLQTVKQEDGDLPPALDLEISDNLTAAAIIPRVEVWMREIERVTGLKPIIYSSPAFLDSYFQLPQGGPPPWAADHILWLANYLDASATQPFMPRGWKRWTIWQHSASGRVNGINGNVDLDWFNGNPEELQALVGLASEPVPVSQSYAVQSGDTLESISQRFKIELRALVQGNPQLCQPGMLLQIPASAIGSAETTDSGDSPDVTTGAKEPEMYIVQPGDTLARIASRFNTTVDRLVQANNITNPNLIQSGQRLVIP